MSADRALGDGALLQVGVEVLRIGLAVAGEAVLGFIGFLESVGFDVLPESPNDFSSALFLN